MKTISKFSYYALVFGCITSIIANIVSFINPQKQEKRNANRIERIPFPKTNENFHTSWITVYHPTKEECGWDANIQASGTVGAIGSCACSQLLFDYNLNYGDTVQVITGSLAGKYVVTDKAGCTGKVIDIWRPVGDTLKGCYKGKFIIL